MSQNNFPDSFKKTMLEITGIFCFNLFSNFALYRVMVRQSYGTLNEAIVQYGWNIYFFAYGFIIIAMGSLLTRTGKYAAVLAHKAINYSNDDSIIDHVKFIARLRN